MTADHEETPVGDIPEVLFVCIHNPGRSVAARVLLDHDAHGRVVVRSAGSQPINPVVAEILRDRGLDPDAEFPKPFTDEAAQAADVIVTMGCGDEVRPIVDDIDRRVRGLLAELVSG